MYTQLNAHKYTVYRLTYILTVCNTASRGSLHWLHSHLLRPFSFRLETSETEASWAKKQKTRQKWYSKFREIDGTHLLLQRFDKFWISSSYNDRKRKLCIKQKASKNDIQNSVKLTDHTCYCNNLTNFENQVRTTTGNGSYTVLQKYTQFCLFMM